MINFETPFRRARRAKGFTQAGIAALAGVMGLRTSQFYISLLERGLVPKEAEAQVFSEILGVDVVVLFDGRVKNDVSSDAA